MLYIGKFINNFKDFYNEINSATLTGAIDVVVIRQPDGTYRCSPFHVRFGKIGVLRSREKVVDIEVNGMPVNIHMKLGESGEAFFVEEVEDEQEIPAYLATSPLPDTPDIEAELHKMRLIAGADSPSKVPNPPSDQKMTITLIQPPSINNISTPVHPTKQSSPNPICDSSNTTAKDTRTELVNDDREYDIPEPRDISNSVHTDSSEEFKTKRKRKKKTSTKKRTKAKEIPIPNSKAKVKLNNNNVVEDNPEEIFHMEDDYGENDDDEGYPSSSGGLSRSISLPVSSTISNLVGPEWTARKMSSTFTGEFHPFSDGDVTPRSSPISSRPPSPMSDTEYEIQKLDTTSPPDANGPSWGWGQLPNVPRKLSDTQMPNNEDPKDAESSNTAKEDENTDAEKRSMLGGMLNFMRSTKKMRHMPESEGIYLSEINAEELDPELAALYFPKFKSAYCPQEPLPGKDEDCESGKGPSLPHSPHTVESSYDAPNSQDSDSDDRLSFDQFSKEKCESISYPYSDIAMSLCGGLQDPDADLPEERFNLSLVTFDAFTENPAILQDSNLVIRIGGKYYNWLTAASMLTSIVMFQRPLPEETTNRLMNEHMPKKKKSKSYSSWWSWRRSGEEGAKSETDNKSETESKLEAENKLETEDKLETEIKPETESVLEPESKLEAESEPQTESSSVTEEFSVPESHTPEATPEPETEAKLETLPETNQEESEEISMEIDEVSSTLDASNEVVSEMEIGANPEEAAETSADTKDVPSINGEVPEMSSETSADNVPIEIVSSESPDDRSSTPDNETVAQEQGDSPVQNLLDVDGKNRKEKYQKSLRLTSKQIIDLNLKEGPNEVVFSVTTAYQGTSRCTCHIFLWNYDDKIVISDIDGTITKSDVLGHILPMVGHNWAQLGVAKLFTKVKSNGYQFLYLSARAIGQARITREYLRSVRQGEICLPDGPLLLSPTSLISALHREVIEKKPEEFKISCLKDIQTLFPNSMGNPFYAGFGNKINDTWAYRAVDIPITRVFTINHRGELKLELIQTFQSSYTRLSDEVDHVFPPVQPCVCVNGHPTPAFSASEEFSYFTYWREPVPTIHEDDFNVD